MMLSRFISIWLNWLENKFNNVYVIVVRVVGFLGVSFIGYVYYVKSGV